MRLNPMNEVQNLQSIAYPENQNRTNSPLHYGAKLTFASYNYYFINYLLFSVDRKNS
jgi:hypothetical protein